MMFKSLDLDIWGSCVTRDPMEFSVHIDVAEYFARMSIVSAVDARPNAEVIRQLKLVSSPSAFHQRSIEKDFGRHGFSRLSAGDRSRLLVVDLIEERFPLGVLADGKYVTLSDPAVMYSNLPELVEKRISPWSEERFKLFVNALSRFRDAVGERPVVIHRAFYAGSQSSYLGYNEHLRRCYDVLAESLSPIGQVEVESEFRRASAVHKWKAGPYHYVDEYYRRFLVLLGRILDCEIEVDPLATMQSTDGQVKIRSVEDN